MQKDEKINIIIEENEEFLIISIEENFDCVEDFIKYFENTLNISHESKITLNSNIPNKSFLSLFTRFSESNINKPGRGQKLCDCNTILGVRKLQCPNCGKRF